MTPERWQVVKEVFHQAAAVPGPELSTFLESACGEDVELRREVESLLQSDGSPMSLLEPPSPGGGIEGGAGGNGESSSIGPYTILHRIGSGGMSEVFLAVRSDDEYRQRVALKLIRRELSSADALQRFRQERQILAGLEHPNIARLLDGGTTPAGLPFFVLEFVEGLPVDEFCRRRRLSLERRLEVFRVICQAVQHAHRNLVVHRDLKPSNVLVTSAGAPKLLDFGVAKLLNPELSAREVAVTGPGGRALTLAYASPEQVAGEPVTTASDVYSLGVMLYELLVGERPYRLEGLTPTAAERRICQEEPTAPSQVARTRSGKEDLEAPQSFPLNLDLDLDLDAIVLQALAKEPSRRYGTAAELEADIVRYLEHQPVEARPSTWSYRALKFIRRHRLGAAFLAAVVIFGAAMAVQSVRLSQALREAHRQREAAGQERAKAEQVSEFLLQLFHLADPRQSRSRSVTAVELLDRGARQASTQLEDQPVVRAALLDTLGRVYRNLGIYEEAEPLLEEGLELRRRHLGDEASEVAVSVSHLAELRYTQARYEEAAELTRQALALRRGNAREDPAALAASLHQLAEILHTSGEYGAAEPVYREALDLRRRIGGREHPDSVETLSDLGYLLFDFGRFDEAEEALRQALDLCRELYSGPHLVTAYTLSYLADLLKEKGKPEAAEPFARESLEMHRQLLGEEHPDTATVLGGLGLLLVERGELEAGTAMLRQSLGSLSEHLGEDHPVVGTQLVQLAGALKAQGDLVEAKSLLEKALAIFEASFPPDHPARATTLEFLADLFLAREERGRAIEAYEAVLGLRRQALDAGHPQIAFSLVRLGIAHRDSGAPWEGAGYLEKAANILRKAYVPGDWRIAYVESEWAAALLDLRRGDQAEALLLGAIAALEEAPNPGSVEKYLQTARQRLDRLASVTGEGAS